MTADTKALKAAETLRKYCLERGCNDITIIINRSTGSISGAPWNTRNANIIWTG